MYYLEKARLAFVSAMFVSLAFVFCGTTFADEVIHSYHSEVTVAESGELMVVETIKVRAEGNQIKRGIYRDFPTLFKTQMGVSVEVPFKVTSVLRDGQGETYRTERLKNGFRVYIGNPNVFLNAGDYTYTIEYTTDFQIAYYKEYDELYWNVTGNQWAFPITEASATVRLPAGVDYSNLKTKSFTGADGSKASNATVEASRDELKFRTTKPLEAQEGLTIVVAIPKGFIAEMTAEEYTQLYAEPTER
ncbi:MAG: DUF2207 domain-containing protein [Pirellulaceae bacterium]